MSNEHNTIRNRALVGNFTMVPNLIDDLGLSLKAHRLYCHMLRVSGADSKGIDRTAHQLAEACKMSARAVSIAKQELLQHGLIIIHEEANPHGGKSCHIIVMPDPYKRLPTTEATR